MTLEREERFTYVEAIAELRRRLADPADDESAAADLAGLIAVEQALDEFDAGVHPFGLQTIFEGTWEFMFEVESGTELLALLIPDPRRRARPDPPMSLETADAIVAGFQLGMASGSGFEDAFGALSDADRDDLSHTARRLHELRHAPVADGQSVGVLMPLRLETRFFEPEQPGGSWRLRLRVFPEEASFDRAPGPATTDEAAHTAAMWQRCDGDFTTPAGRAAFGDLAAKVGGPRAAWLARTLPADGGGIGVDRPRTFSRPRGLPAALMVFLARGGGEPELAEVLSLDRETIAAHMDLNAVYEQVGNPDDPPPDTWWTSFGEAKFVGLAADLDIGESPTTSMPSTSPASATRSPAHSCALTPQTAASRWSLPARRRTASPAIPRRTSAATRTAGGGSPRAPASSSRPCETSTSRCAAAPTSARWPVASSTRNPPVRHFRAHSSPSSRDGC